MGSGPGRVSIGAWDVGKSKGTKNRDVEGEGSGCLMKLKFLGSCMPLRYKAGGSSSGNGKQDAESKSTNGNSRDLPVAPVSSTNSNSGSARSTPNLREEIKISSQLRKFSFNELKLVTRNFKPENLLGEGGFGSVFKGWISQNGITPARPGMGLAVAVKALNHDGLQGHKEWLAEVNYLGELLHPNLVKLIGYCIEDDQRLLVYEFMPRGSLENHLFRRSLPLPWSIRMKIMLGAAKGLAFLHEEAIKPVIFRDFKTSNILLDGDFNAKLSDFGLAKDGPEGDLTHVSTQVMGTYGYAAPEYVMTGHLTSKSDVYSFGVVLLEILTGRRAMDKNRPNGEHSLVEWARPQLGNRRRFYELIDPRLEGHFSSKGAQKAVWLAAHCLCRDPKARPLMSEVVEVLKSLPDLNDHMACSTSSFQAMQPEPSNHSAKYGPRTQSGLSRAGSSSRSIPSGFQVSLSHHNHPLRSSKPDGFQVSPSHHNHPLRSPKPSGFQASPSHHNRPLLSPKPSGFQASPAHHNHPLRSPKPSGFQASPSHHNHPLSSPKPSGFQASPCRHNHPLRSPKPAGGQP